MIVALCVPSRGLVHSRTMSAALFNLKLAQVDWVPCMTHDMPIPRAQNLVTQFALDAKAEWLWFLEEDVIPPPDALRQMLPEARVISAKYRNHGGTWAFSQDHQGRLRYAGMGCVLVHRSVFSALQVPYFDVTSNWTWHDDGTLTSSPIEAGVYGRQDIHFFAQLWQSGIEARLANITCQHATVTKYGEPRTNKGCHEIETI